MADELTFWGWARGALAARANQVQDGRLQGAITLTAATSAGGPPLSAPLSYQLLGPRDVRALQHGAIRQRYPAPNAVAVESDYCAHVEFAEVDLPWRYSLAADPGRPDALKPWLVLVVGTAAEIALLPGGQARLQGRVKETHDLNQAARWAHVQRDHAGREVARLLSPRELGETMTTYFALLTPTFADDGSLRWTADGAPVTVPVYTWWTFQTSDTTLGFVELARRLEAVRPDPGLGYAPLAYPVAPAATATPEAVIGGALVGPAPAELELPDAITDHLAALRAGVGLELDAFGRPVDGAGRPLVSLPDYGAPWLDPTGPGPEWATTLNADPRHRGAAGLGAWAAIEWQEKIVDAATRKMGALQVAAQRLRQLTLGLAATRSLWQRRLLPASPAQRLQILGAALSRQAATQGGTLLEHVTAPGRALPPALFSSAARRLLRPRGPLGRHGAASAMDPDAWLDALNDCDRFATPVAVPEGLAHTERLDFDLAGRIAAIVDELGDDPGGYAARFANLDPGRLEGLQAEEDDRLQKAGVAGEGNHWDWIRGRLDDDLTARDLLVSARLEPAGRPCRPVAVATLRERLEAAFDPTPERPFVVDRVLQTIEGLDDQPLTPPELCLDFHIPAWQFLRDAAPNWLLPGIAAVTVPQRDEAGQPRLGDDGRPLVNPEADPVLAVASNALFTDAFMVGFNQQTLWELRWRNIPVQTGCTPLRRFWEPLGQDAAGRPDTVEDIEGIERWGNTPLGDPQHESEAARGTNLVLVFKTELFRRYPRTLVYLIPRLANDMAWELKPDWNRPHVEPILHATIDPDTVLFGFAPSPGVLQDHWLVVEQPSQGIQFYNNTVPLPDAARVAAYQGATDGGAFADAAFVNPVRLIIQGTLMWPTEA